MTTPSSSAGLLRRGFGSLKDSLIRTITGTDGGTEKMTFYDCEDKNMAGEPVSMSAFKGNVVMVVNVASK